MNSHVEELLRKERGFVIAAAGCGKTHLLSEFVADDRSGMQLILTHTNAGVAALRAKLLKQGVSGSKFSLSTIAGWSARLSLSYPRCSGLVVEDGLDPDWTKACCGAEIVVNSKFGQRILQASYSGVLVDEYQDCTLSQHRLIQAIARSLPCRGVGDPMQSIFGFNEPCVTESDVRASFDVGSSLEFPWRWEGPGANKELGAWLLDARSALRGTGSVTITRDAPVRWIQHRRGPDVNASSTKACFSIQPGQGSAVALLKESYRVPGLAKNLKGLWSTTEAIEPEGREVLRCAEALAAGSPCDRLSSLLDFLQKRMTKMKGALKTVRAAAMEGRDSRQIKNHREHLTRFQEFLKAPSPQRALAILDSVTSEREWYIFRQRSVAMLRTALRHVIEGSLEELPIAVTAERLAARHVGRRTHRRTIGTPLLVKGLEFDHAVVLCEPDGFTLNELYVALTRGARSLTVVSNSPVLQPKSA